MNKLNLAWDTFDFYTMQICDFEAQHLNNVQTIDNFLSNNSYPEMDQRKRLLEKSNKCIDQLIVLYKKQLDSISDLIHLNETFVDIPIEKEIDIDSLIALKNTTATLVYQMKLYKAQINNLLS